MGKHKALINCSGMSKLLLHVLALIVLATLAAARSVADVDVVPLAPPPGEASEREDLSTSDRQKRQMWIAAHPDLYYPQPMAYSHMNYMIPNLYDYNQAVHDPQIIYYNPGQSNYNSDTTAEFRVPEPIFFQQLSNLFNFINNLFTTTTTTTTEETTETATVY